MIKFYIKCDYELCKRKNTPDCAVCKNNHARNKPVDNFEVSEDNDISKARNKNGRWVADMVGSAEQGGLKCPACGYLVNAYTFDETENFECPKCGLPLTAQG